MRVHPGGRLIAGALLAGVVLVATLGGWGKALGDQGTATAELPAAVIASPSAIGEVRFPHAMHVEDVGIECSDCHHETNAGRLRLPHEEYFADFWIDCAQCHQERESAAVPQSCATCHHAAPVSNVDMTLSAKVVIHKSCWKCHEISTGREASGNCRFCHTGAGASAETGP